MKRLSSLTLGFLGIVFIAMPGSHALADKRVALVIGNSAYQSLNQLPNPINDAPDVAESLRKVGFEVIERTNLSMVGFKDALADFARKANGADAAFFYYAGHGLQYQKQNYLLPVDTKDITDDVSVEFGTMAVGDVMRAISRSNGVKIVVLDACRDNPLNKQLAVASRAVGGETRGLARIGTKAEGTIIVYATAADATAQDGNGRNSPFAESLIKRIAEPGLELDALFKKVRLDVVDKTKGAQRPEVETSLISDYYLNQTVTDTQAWARVRESQNQADFEDFVKKYPESPYSRDAQMRIDLWARIRRENDDRVARERDDAAKALEAAALDRDRVRREALDKERAALEAERKEMERVMAMRRDADRLAAEKQESDRLAALKLEADRAAAQAQAQAQAPQSQKFAVLPPVEPAPAPQKPAQPESIVVASRPVETNATIEKMGRDNSKASAQSAAQAACANESELLAQRLAAGDKTAIESMRKKPECPANVAAIDHALKDLSATLARACDADAKALSSVNAKDIAAMKAAREAMSCDRVREDATVRIARLESDDLKQQKACADDRATFTAIDVNVLDAFDKLGAISKKLKCEPVRAEVAAASKGVETRASAVQTALIAMSCYSGKVNGRFDANTRKAIARYQSVRGGDTTEARVTDEFIEELQKAPADFCPSASAPVAAKPQPKAPRVARVPVDTTEDEPAPTPHRKQRAERVARPAPEPAVTRVVRTPAPVAPRPAPVAARPAPTGPVAESRPAPSQPKAMHMMTGF